MFDVIVRGGRVIDPAQNLDAVVEVGTIGPRVAAVGNDLVKQGVRGEVIDATGLVVTPGWIDMHTHVYWGVAPLGVEADPNCLRRGVTTGRCGLLGRINLSGLQTLCDRRVRDPRPGHAASVSNRDGPRRWLRCGGNRRAR